MSTTKIKILIVEDSPVQRDLLLAVLDMNTNFQIVGFAENGLEAIDVLSHSDPDIVLMDLHMPKMNGVEAIKRIMAKSPLPIIAMSASHNDHDAIDSFHALAAGATAFVEKPRSVAHPHFKNLSSNIMHTIYQVVESNLSILDRRIKNDKVFTNLQSEKPSILQNIEVIVIGVSTGGPLVLESIISHLPKDFPPILVVQHISPGFIEGMAKWLSDSTQRPVLVAKSKQIAERGHLYLGPNHFQMGIDSSKMIQLVPVKNDEDHSPTVAYLFNSAAVHFKNQAMGIILTGMGSDGASELKYMRECGALTIAQDRDSALIYGMPGKALSLGAAKYVLSPEKIAEMISSLSKP